MKFNEWVNMSESVKDSELNRILDKIGSGDALTPMEQRFLKTFNDNTDEYYQDFEFLTKNDVFDRIKDVLSSGRKVYYDIYNGHDGSENEILSVNNFMDDDECFVILKNDKKVKLKDNYLYNMIYNMKKDEYSLQSQDEFYEKLPVKNED